MVTVENVERARLAAVLIKQPLCDDQISGSHPLTVEVAPRMRQQRLREKCHQGVCNIALLMLGLLHAHQHLALLEKSLGFIGLGPLDLDLVLDQSFRSRLKKLCAGVVDLASHTPCHRRPIGLVPNL